LSKAKVIEIKRRGFKELTPEALESLDRAIKDVIEGNIKSLEEFIRELKESSK